MNSFSSFQSILNSFSSKLFNLGTTTLTATPDPLVNDLSGNLTVQTSIISPTIGHSYTLQVNSNTISNTYTSYFTQIFDVSGVGNQGWQPYMVSDNSGSYYFLCSVNAPASSPFNTYGNYPTIAVIVNNNGTFTGQQYVPSGYGLKTYPYQICVYNNTIYALGYSSRVILTYKMGYYPFDAPTIYSGISTSGDINTYSSFNGITVDSYGNAYNALLINSSLKIYKTPLYGVNAGVSSVFLNTGLSTIDNIRFSNFDNSGNFYIHNLGGDPKLYYVDTSIPNITNYFDPSANYYGSSVCCTIDSNNNVYLGTTTGYLLNITKSSNPIVLFNANTLSSPFDTGTSVFGVCYNNYTGYLGLQLINEVDNVSFRFYQIKISSLFPFQNVIYPSSNSGIDPELKMYYPFDSNFYNYASGTVVSDITMTGSVTISTSTLKIGNGAAQLTAGSGYLTLPSFNFTTNGFTFSGWYNGPSADGFITRQSSVLIAFSNGSASFYLVNCYDFGGSTNKSFGLRYWDTTISYGVLADFKLFNDANTFLLNNNTWNHVAFTIEYVSTSSPTSNWTFYINGQSYAYQSYYPALGTYNQNYISASYSEANVNGGFTGFIDEYRVYNRKLSSSEVLALYNRNAIATTRIKNTTTGFISLPFYVPTQYPLYNSIHLWVDAQTSACYDNASNITVLYDKSGNNNNTNYRKVIGGGTAAITTISGYNYIRLNKVGFLIGNGNGTMSLYSGDTYSFFCVISINNNSSSVYPRFFAFGNYPSNSSFNDNWNIYEWILYIQSPTSNVILGRGITPGLSSSTGADTVIDLSYNNLSTPSILSIWFDGKTRYARLNGNTAVSSTSPGNFAINFIGINNNTFDPYQTSGGNENSGDFNYGEFIAYKYTANTTQIQQVEGYLATKWDLRSKLPSAHPYSTSGTAFTKPLNNI